MLFPDDKVAAKALNGDYKRLDVSYKDTSDRFKFTSRSDYSKQFAHIYASRLSEMRDLLTLSVEKKWGKYRKLTYTSPTDRSFNSFCRQKIPPKTDG